MVAGPGHPVVRAAVLPTRIATLNPNPFWRADGFLRETAPEARTRVEMHAKHLGEPKPVSKKNRLVSGLVIKLPPPGKCTLGININKHTDGMKSRVQN